MKYMRRCTNFSCSKVTGNETHKKPSNATYQFEKEKCIMGDLLHILFHPKHKYYNVLITTL